MSVAREEDFPVVRPKAFNKRNNIICNGLRYKVKVMLHIDYEQSGFFRRWPCLPDIVSPYLV